jgi:hypothetical protein
VKLMARSILVPLSFSNWKQCRGDCPFHCFNEVNLSAKLGLFTVVGRRRKRRRRRIAVFSSIRASSSSLGVVSSTSTGGISSDLELVSGALNEDAPPIVGSAMGDGREVGDVLQGIQAFVGERVSRKVEGVKKAWVSVEDALAPTPYAPAHGEDTVLFIVLCFAMLSAFWVGNYVAPDWIFSETVFATKMTDKEIANRGDDEADLEILNVTTLEPSPLDIEQYDIEEIQSLKEKKLSDIIKERRPLRDAALLGFQAAQQNAKKLRKSKK